MPPATRTAAVSLSILTKLVLAVALFLTAAPALAQAPQPSAITGVTDRAAAEMARVQRRRVQKLAEKRSLERTYEAQLRALDRLKRSRASWNRDRLIRASKAESQSTAERLSRADLELRAIDGQLRRQRQVLLAAIDRELAGGPVSDRRAALGRMRVQVNAELGPRVRKILLPDDTLDELADPEELNEQIGLIHHAEVELRREREALRQREDRYARMAHLRQQRERATQMGELEDEVVRRTGRTEPRGSGNAGAEGDRGGDDQQEDNGGAPPFEDGGDLGSSGGNGGDGGGTGGGTTGGGSGGVGEDSGFERSSILLTDVVDSTTIDALRRASRSSSPKERAAAALRARRQVEARLQRLERSRALIQRHLGKLRRGQ
ncbi:MAG TPA: hypothetical protein VNO33_19055 [Kofleriaceae bacterium]|nr:hypothetical protein [Kofleriaceae bacterium]